MIETPTTSPHPTTPSKPLRYSPSEKARLLEEFAQSGLSLKAFAQAKHINYWTLRNWRRDASTPKKKCSSTPRPPGFVQVELPPVDPPPPLRLRLGADLVIELYDPRQLDSLPALVQSLRRLPC
jgi:hypothetical protein